MKPEEHPLIKAWIKYAKQNSYCEQCTYPWYDGICDKESGCCSDESYLKIQTAIVHLAYSLEKL